ncbi:MAG: PAS domain-containing protein, partial [Dongiaceae bacterium]
PDGRAHSNLNSQGRLLFGLGAALLLAAFLAVFVAARGFESVSPVWLGGIAGGIALALLTGAAVLLNMRLRERRERDLFASSLDTLPVARQIVAPDGSVFFSSTTYRRMFPDTPTPVKALLEAQMTGEPIEADRLAQLEAQAAAGIAGHTEITIRTATGNVEWRDVSASPLQLLPGYVVWGVEDITPRRQVESIIRREQERFADLVEHAPIGFYSVDEQGRFLFVNATLAAWLELSRSDVAAGRVYLNQLLATPVPAGTPPYDPFGENIKSGEVTLKGPTGKVMQAYVRQEVVPSESGTGIRTRSVVHDLGRERALERALRSAEQRFQRFFEEAPVGIALIDHNGRLEECNTAFRSMVAGEVHGLIGHQLLEFIAEQDRPAVNKRLDAVIAGREKGMPLDVRLKRPQG